MQFIAVMVLAGSVMVAARRNITQNFGITPENAACRHPAASSAAGFLPSPSGFAKNICTVCPSPKFGYPLCCKGELDCKNPRYDPLDKLDFQMLCEEANSKARCCNKKKGGSNVKCEGMSMTVDVAAAESVGLQLS
ncbi:uncharacterized protein RCC_02689 [Ramularia collo-cygni]|uniref:Uncharacterized protein n=1 Tax=Ramularia collo-cygni TaxID=112498 RepID=A0A2D3V2Z0_9PEZI|nr:uncharacterized protein RCC_02689 [Ramularia collo-cygni]CZT16854.1 uncharacterized protein RCC_02689 [Ramularia collo-cygni]